MAHPAPLRVHPRSGAAGFELTAPRLIVAGYTGRDADAVSEHIAELAAIGVPPPPSVPCFFELDPALLTTDRVVEVQGPMTSGEVEPVLIRHAGAYYLGLGSDHTDRDLERVDIEKSKAACPKPLAREVIPVPSGLDCLDWDGITVESRVEEAEYQHGRLAAIRTPADLLALLESALGRIESDLVMFCGTVPLLHGEFVPGTRWRLSLTTPDGTSLSHTYDATRRAA